MVAFFVLPALIMVAASFRIPGEHGGLAPLVENGHLQMTLETYRFFFSDFIYTEIFIKSFFIAGLTTFICIALAYPLALLIARVPKRFRDLMVLLVVLPFASNFLIRVYAWMIILGPQSAFSVAVNSVVTAFGFEPVALLFRLSPCMVGMVYVHLPLMVLPLYTNLEKHNPLLLDAAAGLGGECLAAFLESDLAAVAAGRLLGFGVGRSSRC